MTETAGKVKSEAAQRHASSSQVKLQPNSPSHPSSSNATTSPHHGKSVPMGTGPLTNPFLPTQEAQRMMGGSYPESDVARASLEQMNAISRRAEVAGMSFAPGGNASSSSGPSGSGDAGNNADALKMMANAAGLVDGLVDGDESKMSLNGVKNRQDALARIEELHRSRPTSAQGQGGDPTFGLNGSYQLPFDGEDTGGWDPSAGPGPPGTSSNNVPNGAMRGVNGDAGEAQGTHEGLRVFTMGHLMPKSSNDDGNGNWTFDPEAMGNILPALAGSEGVTYHGSTAGARAVPPPPAPPPIASTPTTTTKSPSMDLNVPQPKAAIAAPSAKVKPAAIARPTTAQKLRVRRSTFVPGWAVPPRVLLVDDDEVNRRMSSKFLQVFGCTIDVAVDGVGAVERMNLEKYDLVLMVSFLSKLFLLNANARLGYRDAETRWYISDIYDPPIRSHDAYYLNDEQLET